MLRDAGLTFGGRPRLRRWWSRPTDPGRAWAVARLALALVVGVLLLGPEWLGGSPPPVFSGPLSQAVGTPSDVQNVTASAPSNTSLKVSWSTPNSDGGQALTGYGIRRRRAEATAYPPASQEAVANATTTQYTYSGLTLPGQTYAVQVRACNDGGSCGVWAPRADNLEVTLVGVPAIPTPPGQVIDVSFDAVTANSFRVLWAAPSFTGSEPLSGYGVLHRRAGASWPGDEYAMPVGKTTRSLRYTGLARGRHGIRIRACNGKDSCGPWSNDHYVTLPAPQTRPGRVDPPDVSARDGGLHVDWDTPSSGGTPTHYDVWHRAGTSGSWTQKEVRGRTSTTVTNLTNGTSYQVQVRAANAAGDGDWSDRVSGTPQGTTVEPVPVVTPGPAATPPPTPPDPECPQTPTTPTAWGKPQNLDVVPEPLRTAVLCWTPVTGAASYVIEAAPQPNPPSVSWDTASWMDVATVTGPTQANKAVMSDIELDAFYPLPRPPGHFDPNAPVTKEGLAHNEGVYGLRVKAVQGTTDSAYSETIIIIDTPIWSANGASPGNKGQAEVHWTPISDILGSAYRVGSTQFRIRQFGEYTTMVNNVKMSYPHTSHKWRPEQAGFVTPSPTPASSGSDNPYTIDDLDKRDIYAIQYTYKQTASTQIPTKVFAARDFYVWPSGTAAGNGERVGTFPLTQRLNNKTYEYNICENTFAGIDADRVKAWFTLIESAAEAWVTATKKTATENLVNTKRIYSGCADRIGLANEIAEKVRNSIGSVIDPAALVIGFVNEAEFDILRDINTSEVIMYNDESGSLQEFRDIGVFPEIADSIGYVRKCWYRLEKGVLISRDEVNMCTRPGYVLGGGPRTSDIFIRRSAYESIDDEHPNIARHTAPDQLEVPENTARFNTCLNSAGGVNSAYSDFLHEVGHALGVGGGSVAAQNAAGHPQIADSVMNYDGLVGVREPDCTPHPFDVMALYALHQN